MSQKKAGLHQETNGSEMPAHEFMTPEIIGFDSDGQIAGNQTAIPRHLYINVVHAVQVICL